MRLFHCTVLHCSFSCNEIQLSNCCAKHNHVCVASQMFHFTRGNQSTMWIMCKCSNYYIPYCTLNYMLL
uniref:Uncharacterized protein n=1 Tax=Anguilla anguilla TaxID=7936 RepID=A0A0E9STU5_ANGAN